MLKPLQFIVETSCLSFDFKGKGKNLTNKSSFFQAVGCFRNTFACLPFFLFNKLDARLWFYWPPRPVFFPIFVFSMKQCLFVTILVACMALVACEDSQPGSENWSRLFYKVETSSSPRAIDLNRDGILDIVLGAGGEEFAATDAAVIALNGANGEELWKVKGRNQIVGSAIFQDITGDGVPDVFIGGRSAQFYAIDGLTGKVLWEYLKLDTIDASSEDFFKDTTMLNFFNPQLIPDQNNDGVQDILTAFGGYVYAQPDDFNRPAGMLMVLDAKTGKVLKKSAMPDGKETYMSPVVYDFGKGLTIIYGTGGETIPGTLYALALDDFMASGTKNSVKIDASDTKGFIAPPIITDLSGDGIGEIVLSTMDGYMKAYNGKDFSPIWSTKIQPSVETQSMPAPVFFDNDKVPDFFNTFNIGTWPENDTAIHVILSGVDGHELFRDTLGRLQYASPVLLDHNEDSYPDVIYPVNLQSRQGGMTVPRYHTQLMLTDGRTGARSPLDTLFPGKILGSTPLITDLDSDGKADLIYTYMTQRNELLTYSYLAVKRIALDIDIKNNSWGGYMGTDYRSIYKP